MTAHTFRGAAAWVTYTSVLLAVLLVTTSAAAENWPDGMTVVQNTLKADTPMTIGDEATLTVEIDHPSELEFEFTRPPDGSRWSEIDRRLDRSPDGEQTRTRAVIRYAIYRPGPTRGPPIVARATRGTDAAPVELDFASHTLSVEAVTDEGESLGTPRPAWPLWSENSVIWWLAGGTIGFGLLALIGAVAIRRRRALEPIELEVSPHIAAARALEELANSDLLADERWMDFYVRLSEIVRRYLGRRFGFPGTELTTTEVDQRLRAVDDPDFCIERSTVTAWLRACDRVKFAGFIPGYDDAEGHLQQAFTIVEQTEPSEEPDEEDPTVDGDGEPEGASSPASTDNKGGAK